LFLGTFLPPVFVYVKKQTKISSKADAVKSGSEADYMINMHNILYL